MSREKVIARSGGRCEAYVALPRAWARCGRPVVEVHHMLKRSRGGHLLDEYTDYHLIALCHQHHRYAETSGEDTGLLIDGYVITDALTGRPVYTGSDDYLTSAFGLQPERVSVLPGTLGGSQLELVPRAEVRAET